MEQRGIHELWGCRTATAIGEIQDASGTVDVVGREALRQTPNNGPTTSAIQSIQSFPRRIAHRDLAFYQAGPRGNGNEGPMQKDSH